MFSRSIALRASNFQAPYRLLRTFVLAVCFAQSFCSTAAQIDVSKLPPPAPRKIDFVKDIRPIFEEHCVSCHGGDKQRSGFRLDQKAAALKGGENHSPDILPGRSADSPLIHFVAGLVKDMAMPQKGERLSQGQIGTLRAWIDQGANWPDEQPQKKHWAFQKPIRPVIPKTKYQKLARNPVDSFVFEQLEQSKLSPAEEADRRTLIRRLSFDLTGLPPSPEEVDAFVRDRRTDAYERLVNRLLDSSRYGERWARHWLDVVRFAETTGFEVNTPRENAWPYRDYVIRSFNDDKPYDRFVMEQLAGDGLGADEATGFIVGGPNDQVKSPDIVLTRQQRADELNDMVATTGSAFLGLTIGCARCHNHKFDPILQTDYYALTAVFSGVHHGERSLKPADYEQRLARAAKLREEVAQIDGELTDYQPLANSHFTTTNGVAPAGRLRPAVNARQNVDRFSSVDARFIRFTILKTTDVEPCLDELEIYSADTNPRNVALAANGARATASSVFPNVAIHKLEHVNDGLYGNDHSWISSEPGKGWIQIELPQNTVINKVVWGRDREQKFSDHLATHYIIEVATSTNHWEIVAGSNDRRDYVAGQSQSLDWTNQMSAAQLIRVRDRLAALRKTEEEIAALTKFPMVYAGTFTKPEPAYRLNRGDPMQRKEEVRPGVLNEFPPAVKLDKDADELPRRLTLAKWIVSPDNPLTARVIVNRLWQHHFGEGIVNTPSDFGVNGGRPSHPELLDWLAMELVQPTFRCGEETLAPWSLKHIHRLILLSQTYRQSSARRANADAIDSSDRLLWRFNPRRLEAEPLRDAILTISGKLDLKMGGPGYEVFEPNDNYVHVYEPKKEFGPAEWRRMIYQFKPRMQQDATFGVFDFPDGGQIAPRRGSSTTPLQALNLLNSRFMMQQAEFFANRLRSEAKDSDYQVQRAFALAFNRKSTRQELAAARKVINEQGLTVFCRALFNANEFLYVF